ncbi:hypothetical protein [Streptomyces sp. NPDC087294]|uniref:hypothetical protein n=1 Tax=Streptomyces sp. NPDC087294 TaxID=3365777 RepID=UPI003811E7BD
MLRGGLPQPSCDSFMSARPRAGLLRVALDSELTNTAAREQAVVHGVDVELYSTVAGADPPGQVRVPAWSDLPVGVGVSRQRCVEILASPSGRPGPRSGDPPAGHPAPV